VTDRLFDEAFLRRLEHLSLVTRRPVAGHLRGAHRSRRTGTGMVFTDFRPYTPGDDTRNLDWSTYLRLDRLLLRLFEEEAELPVYVLIDASASMGTGEPSKFDFARRVCAALACLALHNQDRVSLIAFADGVVRELPVRRGRTQIWPVFHFLGQLEAAGATSIETTLKRAFGSGRTRGLVVIASDFMDPTGFAGAARWLQQFRHEVVALQVLSPQEIAPDLPEDVEVVDSESRAALHVHVTPTLRDAYRDALAAHQAELGEACRRAGWTWIPTRSDAPFETLMLTTLREAGVLR
jgi:uncharacterized protein (DUF58 family)